MTSATIAFRVTAAECAEITARAERDKVTLSDYIRVRLGLRGEGPQDGDSGATTDADDGAIRTQLADHARRLAVLEADRPAIVGA